MKTIIVNPVHSYNNLNALEYPKKIDFTNSFARKLFGVIQELGRKSVLIDGPIKSNNKYTSNSLQISIGVNQCEGSGFEIYYPNDSYSSMIKKLIAGVHYAYKSVADRWCIPGLPDSKALFF